MSIDLNDVLLSFFFSHYILKVFEKIIAFKRNDPKSRRLSTICEILHTANV